MKKKKSGPNLIGIVNDWLDKNRPFLYVDDHGSIGLRAEIGLQSKAFGTLWFGSIGSNYAEFVNPNRYAELTDIMIEIDAADPKFFEKLSEHLPSEMKKEWLDELPPKL